MRRKLITIRDVAAQAGVSLSTVSHVLNGNDQHVGAVKRARVLAAIEDLHYRPNAVARSMVKQKTAAVGLVLTEVDNPLFVPVVAGVEELLRPAGYHIVLASAPDVENEIQAIETLRSQQVDGFIFMSLSLCYPFEHLLHLQSEGVPFVTINRYLDGNDEINSVLWDDYSAGYKATEHLLKLGHTHIATISGPIENDPPRRSAIERHRGWLQALQERDLPTEHVVAGDYTYKGGYQAAQKLVAQVERGQDHPTGLFVASDVMAIGALKAFHQAGVQVPHDLSLVTIGDPPFAAYTIPALTTLSLPALEAGQVAARILLDWLTNGKSATTQHVTLSFSMTVRESCEAVGASPVGTEADDVLSIREI